MDEILKSFQLPFLLRSFFAGVFFVLSFCAATNAIIIDSKNIFSIGLPFALISGVTVYGIHRSLLYPFLEWGFNANWTKRLREKWFTLISRNAIKNLVTQWDSKAKSNEIYSNRSEHMTIWADYIHLQLASSWCIWLGYILGKLVNNHCGCPCQYRSYCFSNIPFFWLAGIFLVAGLISNWRARSVEEHWDDKISSQN